MNKLFLLIAISLSALTTACSHNTSRMTASGDDDIIVNDTDMDGVVGKDDKCPQHAGPVANGGCPEAAVDSDKDGFRDEEDQCPNDKGRAATQSEKDAYAKVSDACKDCMDECPHQTRDFKPCDGGCPGVCNASERRVVERVKAEPGCPTQSECYELVFKPAAKSCTFAGNLQAAEALKILAGKGCEMERMFLRQIKYKVKEVTASGELLITAGKQYIDPKRNLFVTIYQKTHPGSYVECNTMRFRPEGPDAGAPQWGVQPR